MMRNNRNHFFIVLLISLLTFNITALAQPQDSQEALKYRVAVNVMVVPIFAVDKKGNPVYDLKEDEIKLFVNDEPTGIMAFKRFEFGHEEKIVKKTESGETIEVAQAPTDRFIFIILDTMFNSLTGFKRGKAIAMDLVKKAAPGDNFIILENNPVGGLKYIGGPEKDWKILSKKLNKIAAPPEKWTADMHNSRWINPGVDVNPQTDARMESDNWKSLSRLHVNSESQRYQHQVEHFSRVLGQFKYALKTIDKPKIVFLISEGIARGAFRAAVNGADVGGSGPGPVDGQMGSEEKGFYSVLNKTEKRVFDQNKIYSAFMLKYLVDVVKSINNGGSVLYTINPKRTNLVNDDEKSGEMSLRYMAGESGGKYFAGAKPAKIVERVKKTTAAYYELFYAVIPDMPNTMNVRLECSRPDVRVHSLIHTERNRPYLRMPTVQKKLFALNVVTKGSWSRMVGKVMKVKHKKIKPSTKEKEKLMTIRVLLPKVMQNKKVDIFSIRMHPKTHKTAIDKMSGKAKDVVNLKVKPRKEMLQYFVVIEPTTPYCIYNQI